MEDKLFTMREFSITAFSAPWNCFISCSLLLIAQILLVTPGICQGSEIIVRLSGGIDYPGDLSILSKTIEIRKICFLGVDAKGKIDKAFLRLISSKGTPKGDYEVSPPFPDENWPVKSFIKNGALRLKIVNGPGMETLNPSNKSGVAIHGRDFYPILDGIVKKKTMIMFHNDLLFERLQNHWGPLRISNWDMGRLADSWAKMNQPPKQWQVKVIDVQPEEIKSFCKPPVTKRTLD